MPTEAASQLCFSITLAIPSLQYSRRGFAPHSPRRANLQSTITTLASSCSPHHPYPSQLELSSSAQGCRPHATCCYRFRSRSTNTLLRGQPSFHCREVHVPLLLPCGYGCNVPPFSISRKTERHRTTQAGGDFGRLWALLPHCTSSGEVPRGLSSPAWSVFRGGDSWAPLLAAD